MNTRDALLGEARRAFSERGYTATSLAGLAAARGLTKAAIYHHFPSKRALLEALLDDGLAAAQAALTSAAPLEARLKAYARVYGDHLEPLSAVASAQSSRRGGDSEAVEIAQEHMRRGVALLESALAEAVGDERAKLLAPTFSSIVHGAYMMARHHPGLRRDDLLDEGVRVFVYGLEPLERRA